MQTDEVKTVDVNPSQLGWRFIRKDEQGNKHWLTDAGETYIFRRGQKEVLVVPRT